VVDDRGLPPGGSAAEGRRGVVDGTGGEHCVADFRRWFGP